MSDRQRLVGGISTLPAAISADTRAEYKLPSGSILAGGPALERSNALQALFDCLTVLAVFLLVSATGVGIALAAFCLFFVRLV